MKSNVCKIEKGTRDLGAILKESERVAVYNELTHKQTLQLRLLCEEIDGMLPNIIDVFDGEFWIDFENHVCKVNVLLKIPEFNIYQKEGEKERRKGGKKGEKEERNEGEKEREKEGKKRKIGKV